MPAAELHIKGRPGNSLADGGRVLTRKNSIAMRLYCSELRYNPPQFS